MSFKDVVERDLHGVFLQNDEFADIRSVRYDGVVYPDVSIVLEGPEEARRGKLSGFGQTRDNVPGLYAVSAVLHMAAEDLGGLVPKQGARIEISTREGGRFFKPYHVATSENQMGMLRVELEAIDQ